ncbi:hypothetical protein ACRCQJ_12575 [Pseudomonas aeruginosa]|jgi:hypothetical protein|nr:hypothetical protein [Pseudomonas aeruginosa]MCV4065601.1 hypothetical protein [Pseudomonas aeruginosa]MCV4078783.1 hypothetical protein [Pseudomonas aeruginosa]MCV4181350.1 hypothetical protein [Pseudomonas aeruginosa]MCV4221557.1 hypothetical protein [Pseudomonas aeruginosa]
MKYIGFDLIERECNGPYTFNLVTDSESHFPVKYLKLEHQPSSGTEFHPITFAMEVVASEPPFLRKQECPWILSYMDDLRSFYNSKYLPQKHDESSSLYFHAGESISSKVNSFAMENDAVSATRMMYAIDIAYSILYGSNVLDHDYFISKETTTWLNDIYQLFLIDAEFLDRHIRTSLEVNYDKSFKTLMTRSVFKDTQVMVTIPEGEALTTANWHGKDMTLTSGTSLECTIVRFYKTDLWWSNRGAIEFYPTFNKAIRSRLQDEPLFAVEMELAKELQRSLYGAKILAFVPLHWISFVYHHGQWLEVNQLPVPSESDSKLPIPLTTSDFCNLSTTFDLLCRNSHVRD